MENYADFLPFSEEVQQAFENYNVEASTLTIKAFLQKTNVGSVIGRIVWRSPLLKIGTKKNIDAVYFTLMDADKREITGTAWGAIAQRFNETLENGKIYKFSNAVPINEEVHQRAKHDKFESRVPNQTYELRFSGLVDPEEVRQNPFPDLDQSQFRLDYERIQFKEVTSVVGLVTCPLFKHKDHICICLSSGVGKVIAVLIDQDKYEELKEMPISPMFTVLGILGVSKLKDINTKTTGDKCPRALYRTYNDSAFMIEPICAGAEDLVYWRNELPNPEAEMLQKGKTMEQ